jgi:hypothetical protein
MMKACRKTQTRYSIWRPHSGKRKSELPVELRVKNQEDNRIPGPKLLYFLDR